MIFERVEIEENMKNDEELEMLLDEIPHATSRSIPHHLHQQHNGIHRAGHGDGSFISRRTHGMYGVYDDDSAYRYKYTYACSPVSGLSLHSDGSSSTLCSGGNSLSDNGSPTPPPLEELKPHMPCGSSHYSDGLRLDSKRADSYVRMKTNESLIDELGLCRNLSKVYIANGEQNFSNLRDLPVDRDRLLYRDCNISGSNQIKTGGYTNVRRGPSDYMGFRSSVPLGATSFDGQMSAPLSGLQQECETGNSLGSRLSPMQPDKFFPQFNYSNGSMNFPRQITTEQTDKFYIRGSPFHGLPVAESLFHARPDGRNVNEEREELKLPNSPRLTNPRPHLSLENMLCFGLSLSGGRTMTPSKFSIPQAGIESFTREESLIIQGEAFNHAVNKGFDYSGGPSKGVYSGGQSKGVWHDIGVSKPLGRSDLDSRHQNTGICDNSQNNRIYSPQSRLPNYTSLAEAQGFIYLLAKDQHGCRFLQRIFEGGAPKDVQIVFNEIIDHVAELMVNPFGNYLMQKLLDVCTEGQRKQILLRVTAEPGQLVRISLNPHGTRVVQKLIETLRTKHEILLVTEALEPGFLPLIKDLNGNHVIQRCLQCLSIEYNKFIFVAGAKYCVDIATHQHGCCVLQRCISHSVGEHQENLVAEISANGLLLAQDAYGNYVVQFILELRIPSATSKLASQFEGNYVELSKQKFSSHVVEKCLDVFNGEGRSRIIHELLSVSHFEQLLQHPHANYVVQTALRVSEGHFHNLLVEEIESHKASSRNSPYSKKIFSQKLLKK